MIAAALLLAPLGLAQDRSNRADAKPDDVRRAIQFQRTKDRADARQAEKERVHPSVVYDGSSRRAEDRNTVPDPGEGKVKKDKHIQ